MATKTTAPVAQKKKKADRGIVAFHLWQSLAYPRRLLISFLLIAAGFILEATIYYLLGWNLLFVFVAGAPLIILGNALLLVKGYDNRVDFSRLEPTASWETVGRDQLKKVRELDRTIGKWDARWLDVTNGRGFFALIVILIALIVLLIILPGLIRLLIMNTMLLVLPHWFTGTTRILRLPKLLVKVETMDDLLEAIQPQIGDCELQVMMLLKGKDKKVPDDVKFRLTFPGQDDRFLGLYGQVVTNDVQGSSYPYFYTVIVARKGYGLPAVLSQVQQYEGITVESGGEDEVEFIVVRQYTTKTSGYHTDLPAAIKVFMAGLGAARLAVQPQVGSQQSHSEQQ